jgi:Ca2+-transporting ATPase
MAGKKIRESQSGSAPSWHSLSIAAAYSLAGSSKSGLTQEEAARRLLKYGPNELESMGAEPWYFKLLSEFKSLPILMLVLAAAISIALGFTSDSSQFISAGAIIVAIFIAVFFGFFQEYKAERALDALKKMVVQRSVVLRSGIMYEVDSRTLVPGDIVVLSEGHRVMADMRLVESSNLACDQSILTGESHLSRKSDSPIPVRTPLGDRSNMLYCGTIVARGHCIGLVVATDMKTEFGKIAAFVSKNESSPTPLERDIDSISHLLGAGGIIICVLFFVLGFLEGIPVDRILLIAITLAVAIIPEGLPTVLAITLAIGVQKMASEGAIVRKMQAVETLGSATVVCTDKTGTLTQNRINVHQIILPERTYDIGNGTISEHDMQDDPVLARAIEGMVLCNNAMFVKEGEVEKVSGDPTEAALLWAARECSGKGRAMRLEQHLISEIPFNAARRMMTSVREYGKKRTAYVKGAPEQVLLCCTKILTEKGERALTRNERSHFLSEASSLGAQGMRSLALAYREIGVLKEYTAKNAERELVFVGLVGMEDPPRAEAAEAVALCQSAGIRVIMVTGDSLQTASIIASRVGILKRGMKTVDCCSLDSMSDEQLKKALLSTAVFARTTPEQKYRIVSLLKAMGEVVAVTGDGINDAPAMKTANIGVAMGISGTDVTKEVADIVLSDDNFASIVRAVRYGRTTFSNIKSFVRYQLSTNVGAVLLMFAALAFRLPLPLLPLQILWINVMVDGPPALALGMEPSSRNEMNAPPRDTKESFITKNLMVTIIFTGVLIAMFTLAAFTYYLSYAPMKAYTEAFVLFVLLQLTNAFTCRAGSKPLHERLFSNRWLLLAIFGSLLVHVAIIYYAPLQLVFHTMPLDASDLLFLVPFVVVMVLLEELKKKYLPLATKY